jgi:hypothetical protein
MGAVKQFVAGTIQPKTARRPKAVDTGFLTFGKRFNLDLSDFLFGLL